MFTPDPFDNSEIELAKRIACAAISYQMDISYQTYWNRYFKGENSSVPGPSWLEVARLVRDRIFKRGVLSEPQPLINPLVSQLVSLAETLPDEDLQLAISFLEGRAEHYRENPGARP